MEMDPKRYTYQVRWNDENPTGYIAHVAEFPHLSAVHPGGPAEAIEILESKVFRELQWWKEQGDPPVRPMGSDLVSRRPPSLVDSFLYWASQIWDSRGDRCFVGSAFELFNNASVDGSNRRTNAQGFTDNGYETFTHLGLRMAFTSQEHLELAYNNVALSFGDRWSRPLFEAHASAFLNPTAEGDVEVPTWEPNESARGGHVPQVASHSAFIALPEPATLPPRTSYSVRIELGELFPVLREVEQVWVHDRERIDWYGEIRVFLYGRRRERNH